MENPKSKSNFSTKFYTMAADLVSILVVLNSLLRMTVHMICNPQFRERFRLILVKFSSCWIPVAKSDQAMGNDS
ncbi:unnamed protein product [Brugia pahangi]|uniref:G_PROTEIN_RECEP_F1_2 domain-containing protein n=1 Tax=Brugia pahangi TaxID=6280 RepID=A0A0N4TFG0_BRUPA|nr:unnamed protein product [Brugia pahangi]